MFRKRSLCWPCSDSIFPNSLSLGPSEERFSVEINHGGMFCGHGNNKSYVDCRTEFFDDCEVETWSLLWIHDFLEQLGYVPEKQQVYWLLSGKGFSDGLHIVDNDSNTLMMTAVVPKFQFFKLYVNDKDLFAGVDLDDICMNGSPELPPVISPKPTAYVSIPSPILEPESDDSDSNFGSDLIDSDNEVDKDDDDLFEENVDMEIIALRKKGT